MARRVYGKTGCSVEATLSVMGGTWKPVILFYLVSGTKRFMELTRLIPNATQSMLTSQLRELEADGVVVRHVYPEVPPKVEYRLSELGQTLVPVLLAMRDWGRRTRRRIGSRPRRGATATRLNCDVAQAVSRGFPILRRAQVLQTA